MARIIDLPVELIEDIFSYLRDPKDFFAARVAHRRLERASISLFGARFFRKKGFMIVTPSITVLKGIAAHDDLRKYVKHLWFNPDLWTFVEPSGTWRQDWAIPWARYTSSYEGRYPTYLPLNMHDVVPKESQAIYHRWVRYWWDHYGLLFKGGLAEELTGLLARFPNLRTIGMRRSEDHPAYGWRMLKNEVGKDPRALGPIPNGKKFTLSGSTHLFIAIIKAVASTNTKLERLYTDAVEIDNVLPRDLPQEVLDSVFHSLLSLEVNASKAWLKEKEYLNDMEDRRGYSTLNSGSEYGDGLLKLFKAAPQLREVGVQIFSDPRDNFFAPLFSARGRPLGPESWRQKYPYLAFRKVADNVQLENLTKIKLEKFTTTLETLLAFLAPSRAHLTSLKMRQIRLLSSQGNVRPWTTFFEFLRHECTQLSYLLLCLLAHESGAITFIENESFDHVGLGGRQTLGAGFTFFDNVSVVGRRREEVERLFTLIFDRHYYHGTIGSHVVDEVHWFTESPEIDEVQWYTDTSDEEC